MANFNNGKYRRQETDTNVKSWTQRSITCTCMPSGEMASPAALFLSSDYGPALLTSCGATDKALNAGTLLPTLYHRMQNYCA